MISKNVTYNSISTPVLGLVWKHTVSLDQLLGKPKILNPTLNIQKRLFKYRQFNLSLVESNIEHQAPVSQLLYHITAHAIFD